jgi:uncharacterized membrane protein YphA (DoxX/SURF4 family)
MSPGRPGYRRTMPVTRVVARPLLASIFIAGGIDALRNPAPKAKLAEPVTSAIAGVVPSLPDDAELLVRANAAVQVGAGACLALGKVPRLSAALLAGSLVPTTFGGHRFWEETDPLKRAQQRTHFLKNASLLGALILAAADTGGAPSIGWRARHARRRHPATRMGAAALREGASAARDLASHGAVAALGAAGALASAARDAGAPTARQTVAAARETGVPAARHVVAAARETGVPAARHVVAVAKEAGVPAARQVVAAARETGVPAAKQAAAAIRELPVRETVGHLTEIAREALPA